MALTVTDPQPIARAEEILTPKALAFVEELHKRFAGTRTELLKARGPSASRWPGPASSISCRKPRMSARATGRLRQAPAALQDRRVEMTGPATPPKMAINALNSGAKVWLADLEDASTPTWANVIDAILNLRDAATGTLSYTSPEGKEYRLRTDAPLAVVVARPRGWHMDERHLLIDGEHAVGALVDFGLHFFHIAKQLVLNGHGPYYYLPKMESHLEARLWNDVFVFAQDFLGIPQGTIQRHRADRNHPGRVRDGRDPLRTPRPRRGLERRPLGLPLQHHQVLPRRRSGVRAAGPRHRGHDGAVHARLHRTAGQDLPPPRRLCHGRHGCRHPQPPRTRGHRPGVREGPRGQDPRGQRRL